MQAAAEPAAQGKSDTAANQPGALKGNKKKKKRKHSEGEETQAVPKSDAQALSTAAMPAVQASLAAPVSEAVPGQAGEAPAEAASKPKKKKKQKHAEAASAARQSAAPSPAPDAEAATAAAAAHEAVVADAGESAASQADPGIKTKKKKKKRKHSEPVDQAIHSAPSASGTAPAEAGPSDAAAASAARAADPSTAQHEAAALSPETAPAVKPKKRKLKHKDAQAQKAAAAAAASSTHFAASGIPTDADAASEQIAAAFDSSVHSGQPAPKVKRKRKSKALDTVPSAEAGVPSAEEAAGAASAQLASGTQSKAASPSDKASISASVLQSSWRENAKRQDVKKGKFTKQEKDTLKQAAIAYAQEHNLPTTDFAWLFCTRSLNSEYKGQATGAWRSISESLPHRTNKAVYACGTRMLHERNYQVGAPAAMPLPICISSCCVSSGAAASILLLHQTSIVYELLVL